MKRIIEVDENLICEGFVRNFTEKEKDVLINAIVYSKPYEERPQGKWIYTPNISGLSEYEGITCSICGNDSVGDFNFCPDCGADMRGDNNENND